MKYTVVWHPTAEQKLAEIWTTAERRDEITHTADAIDAMLASHPLDVGESRGGKSRVLLVPPSCVYYDVEELDRLVAVWAIWQGRSHR